MKRSLRLLFVRRSGCGGQHVYSFIAQKNHRISLVILFFFVLFVASVPKHDITAVILYAVFPILFVIAENLPVQRILKRLLFMSPFIVFMAAANPFLDRMPYITVYTIPVSSGMVSGVVIILKSMVTITAVLAFSHCVPFFRVCEVLRVFRVPDVFVTQLVLLYRYSFLLVEEAMTMQKARALRSFGKKGRDLSTTARLIGSLLLRTHDKAGRIYRGMLARGFTGELSGVKKEKITCKEILLGVLSFLVFALIRAIF